MNRHPDYELLLSGDQSNPDYRPAVLRAVGEQSYYVREPCAAEGGVAAVCPCGARQSLRLMYRCFFCEIYWCRACAYRHFNIGLWTAARVKKVGGDYTYEGVVVSAFKKLSGATRIVVEDDRGLLHIFNPGQLRPVNENAAPGAPEPVAEAPVGRGRREGEGAENAT